MNDDESDDEMITTTKQFVAWTAPNGGELFITVKIVPYHCKYKLIGSTISHSQFVCPVVNGFLLGPCVGLLLSQNIHAHCSMYLELNLRTFCL